MIFKKIKENLGKSKIFEKEFSKRQAVHNAATRCISDEYFIKKQILIQSFRYTMFYYGSVYQLS